jgi:hypothetical protein
MLLKLAIADTYGVGFEYAHEIILNNYLSRYVEHPRFRLIPVIPTIPRSVLQHIARCKRLTP